MGYYSYKEVCHDEEFDRYRQEWEKENGRECDGDANYDGDYWLVAAWMIADLRKQRDGKAALLREALGLLREAQDGNKFRATPDWWYKCNALLSRPEAREVAG